LEELLAHTLHDGSHLGHTCSTTKLRSTVGGRWVTKGDKYRASENSSAEEAAPANHETLTVLKELLVHAAHDGCHLDHSCVATCSSMVRQQLDQHQYSRRQDDRRHADSGGDDEDRATPHDWPNGP